MKYLLRVTQHTETCQHVLMAGSEPELVWTRVGSKEWRKIAPGTSASAAEVAVVQPTKRAKTGGKIKHTNWLTFLEHKNNDAYRILMEWCVRVEALEVDRSLNNGGRGTRPIWTPIRAGERPFGHFHPCSNPYGFGKFDVNIYSLPYSTVVLEDIVCICESDKRLIQKEKLLAAAESNGIKAYKSWSKPRIWKALLSA